MSRDEDMSVTKSSHHSIGKRIGRLVAVSVFTAVTAAASGISFVNFHQSIAATRASLEGTAYVLAASAADALVVDDQRSAMNSLRAVGRMPNIVSAYIIDRNQKLLANVGYGAFLEQGAAKADTSSLALLQKSTMAVGVDIVKNGQVAGQLVMVANIDGLRFAFLKMALSTLVAGVLAALLGVFVAVPLQRRVTGPISALTSNIQKLRKSKDYSEDVAAIDNVENDEVGVLAHSFNGFMQDIRNRDRSLRQLAYYDPLTGLPNRAYLLREISTLKSERETGHGGIVVALFNIHGFREMNDAFGHSMGDGILMSVAAQIKQASGASDKHPVEIARFGGDEFALLAADIPTIAMAEETVARVQAAFLKPMAIGQMELHVVLTAGAFWLAAEQPIPDDVGEFTRYADLALNAAKRQGAGRAVFFRPTMAEQLRRETEIIQALRYAINAGGLEVHYQAQMDFATGMVTGFEALARWHHPLQGYISPGIFIPLAERNGLIVAIGDWILRAACREAAKWLYDGERPRSIAVNVSPAQIMQAGFVEKVQAALLDADLPAELLCVEITESLFLGDRTAEVIAVLNRLNHLGISLALDDFGTGYSSLGYLARLPFHKIKVDRSFVAEAEKSERRTSILKSVIEMSHTLGMSVVAEGAETIQELALLNKLGADSVQGFGIARPLPSKEALEKAHAVEARSRTLRAPALVG
jgi:diguanylate cyclase (GGDEF)-like protein